MNYEKFDFIIQKNKRKSSDSNYLNNGVFSGCDGIKIKLGNIWHNTIQELLDGNDEVKVDIGFIYYIMEYKILHATIHEELHKCIYILFKNNKNIGKYQLSIESDIIERFVDDVTTFGL
jgi:hypothetical protein